MPAPVKELVSLGIQALPELIAHVDDARPTKFTIKPQGIVMSIWYSKEIDVRSYDRVPQPAGTVALGSDAGGPEEDILTEHSVTVGDICFATIGQIVNRGYCASRYQPSSCEVVNSPTHTPALAEAVRAEWGSVTDDEFKASLVADAESSDRNSVDALKRLCYYYPEDGKRLALSMLGRPICDRMRAADFVDSLLEMRDWYPNGIRRPQQMARILSQRPTPFMAWLVAKAEFGVSYGQDLIDPHATREQLVDGIADRLDRLQAMPDLYDPAEFSKVKLRPETVRLLAYAKTPFEHYCANRRLLEDTFPDYLIRRPYPCLDPTKWRAALDKFVRRSGPQYREYVWVDLRGWVDGKGAFWTAKAEGDRARTIIKALFPDRDLDRPGIVNAATIEDQKDLVEALRTFHDVDLDTAVGNILRQCTRMSLPDPYPRGNVDEECGLACVVYLNGRGYQADGRTFLQANIDADMQRIDKGPDGDDQFEADAHEVAMLKRRLVDLK